MRVTDFAVYTDDDELLMWGRSTAPDLIQVPDNGYMVLARIDPTRETFVSARGLIEPLPRIDVSDFYRVKVGEKKVIHFPRGVFHGRSGGPPIYPGPLKVKFDQAVDYPVWVAQEGHAMREIIIRAR